MVAIPSGNQTWQWKNPLWIEVWIGKSPISMVHFPARHVYRRVLPHQSIVSVCVPTASDLVAAGWGIQSDSSRCGGKSGQRNSGDCSLLIQVSLVYQRPQTWLGSPQTFSGIQWTSGTFIELKGGFPARHAWFPESIFACFILATSLNEILLPPNLVTKCYCFFSCLFFSG